jgi:hypothetical protein
MDIVSVPFRLSDTKGAKQLIKYDYFRLQQWWDNSKRC